MKPSHLLLLLGCALGAAAPLACSQAADPQTPAGTCFQAYLPQFAGFRTWTSFDYQIDAAPAGNVHFTGPRTEWISALPPAGSKTFPVGTIIVKEIYGINQDSHHIFAMVKHGCDYNADGAKDWEFFELSEGADDTSPLSILWQGVAPPPGEVYAGASGSGCNTCHAACSGNDSVCSSAIELAGD